MLHRPLHAAAYYLNPQLHYRPEFKADIEVRKGLMDCITRMVEDPEEQAKIEVQMHDFKKQIGYFGTKIAKLTLDKSTPADWWESVAFEYPELQRFAIRILSLTCSSSGCERNWSAFEMVHTKRRNRLKQKTMNDVVFVMANSRLSKKKKERKTHEMEFNDISSDDDWVLDMNVEDGSTDNLDEDFVLVNEDQNEKDEDVTIVHNLEEHVGGRYEYEGEDEFEDENEDEDNGEDNEGGNDDPLGDYDLLQHELFGNY